MVMENTLPSSVKNIHLASHCLEGKITDWIQDVYKVTNHEEKVDRKLLLSASQFQLVASKHIIRWQFPKQI